MLRPLTAEAEGFLHLENTFNISWGESFFFLYSMGGAGPLHESPIFSRPYDSFIKDIPIYTIIFYDGMG